MLTKKPTKEAVKAQDRMIGSLEKLGLHCLEAKLYVVLLSSDSLTISEAARAAGIKRTTTYSVVDALARRGLVAYETRGSRRRVRALSPEQINEMIEQQRQTSATLVPELLSIFRERSESVAIRTYEGLSAIKRVYEELLPVLRKDDDYLVIGNQAQWLSLDQDYFHDFTVRRGKLPIRIRMILVDSEVAKKIQCVQHLYNEEIRLLPSGVSFHTNFVIVPNRVVIHELHPPGNALVIDNKGVVKTLSELFNLLWETLPSPSGRLSG